MAVLYLEDYIEAIDTLPQDMKSNFSHLRTMELQVQSAYMWGFGWRVLWLYTLVGLAFPSVSPPPPPLFFLALSISCVSASARRHQPHHTDKLPFVLFLADLQIPWTRSSDARRSSSPVAAWPAVSANSAS